MTYCNIKHQQQWLHQTKYKTSAAVAVSHKMKLTSFQSLDMGLAQDTADNFAANIFSPNGLKSTHTLALLMTQLCPNTEEGRKTLQSRLKKKYVKDSTPTGITILTLWPSKNPEMPEMVLKKCILPLKVLAQQRILVQRSKFHDFNFFKSAATYPLH